MKNNRTFLEKLLDGAEVEWKPLGKVTDIKTGQSVSKNIIAQNPGIYPVINSGREPLGFINEWNTENDPIGITTRGAGVGSITWQEGKYFRGNLNYSVTIKSEYELNVRFLYHILLHFQKEIHNLCSFTGIPALNASELKKLEIPIPPLSVQTEIVKILDALTALTSELTSELTLRRKQYEYYREKLLSHDSSEYSTQKSDNVKFFHTSNIQWLHLNEIYKFQYGIGNKIPTIGGEYPVYGSNGIVGTHNEYNSENAPVIGHIGAYAGIVNWAEGKHFVTYNGIICNKINDNVNSRYAYYLLLSQNFIDKANKASQPFISYDILNKCIVPVPPLEEQQRIVSILDKFEALTNSITEGLPLAIEQSQKRYEYYRELLLSF